MRGRGNGSKKFYVVTAQEHLAIHINLIRVHAALQEANEWK